MTHLYRILFESSGAFYAFVSGWGADLGLIGGGFMLYRRHNCCVHWCPRVCRFDVAGTPFRSCRRHHPEVPTKGKITPQHIADACLTEHDRRDHTNVVQP